ncbi:adenosylcobinamide-phosphate synthase CbiB [Tibeticola sp.]|uniref:adenosylcobinamide-phosphate synthase CbiB n=1 Tax=Tibeticola sp. TaxID=2005368 RepID=UPI0025EE99D1|nr:adenosylcobinamide-phosphate synthase CbiB [Tibeticola sp.]
MDLGACWRPDAPVLAGAVLVALAWDWRFGEPAERLHPVVWMGHYLGAVGRRIARPASAVPRPGAEFWAGALAWCLGAALVLALATAAALLLRPLHPLLQALGLGVMLKPLLAWRMLRDEVRAVEAALERSLQAGRQRVARLVSRDVHVLSPTQVREAAVSTLAENLNDSVVAPLFWFAVAGLPGAALYRFANTADAMWGYRGERGGRDWTWAGKWAARVDDGLSWLPARLSALLIALPSGGRGWMEVAANAGRTPSPNGGWPMGALAVALGIRLGKPGVYELNPAGRPPQAADTARAVRRCGQAVAALALLAAAVVLAAMLWASLP